MFLVKSIQNKSLQKELQQTLAIILLYNINILYCCYKTSTCKLKTHPKLGVVVISKLILILFFISENCGNAYSNDLQKGFETEIKQEFNQISSEPTYIGNDPLVDAFNIFRKEVTGEIQLMRNTVNSLLYDRRDDPPQVQAHSKISVSKNFEEFENLERNLLDPEYHKQVVAELCRFKGKCLQSSLSSMLTQLISRDLLKQFCFTGSKGRNSSEIQKRAFKQTICYGLITGNFNIQLI